MIKIPFQDLSDEALEGLIDEFVTREGTDYGHGDFTLEGKRADVRRQLEAGEAVITFDPRAATTHIVTLAGS